MPEIFERSLALGLELVGQMVSVIEAGLVKVQTRRRRRFVGGAGSIAFHSLLLFALLWAGVGRPVGYVPSSLGGGRPDAYDGKVLGSIAVSLASARSLGLTPTSATSADARAGGQTTLKPRLERFDGCLPLDDAKSNNGAQQAPSTTESQPAPSPASPASAAAANGLANLPAQAQGGDPDGSQNLLRQIARCLPPGMRPTIPFAKLYVALDPSGALRLAPRMDASLPYPSRDAVKQADLIVQAALQCGPYKAGGAGQQVFALTPDFSFLDGPAATSVAQTPTRNP